MQLSENDVQTLLQAAIKAAKEAGAFIATHSDSEIDVEIKEDGLSRAAQVVTHIDRQSQDIVFKYIL